MDVRFEIFTNSATEVGNAARLSGARESFGGRMAGAFEILTNPLQTWAMQQGVAELVTECCKSFSPVLRDR